MDGNTRLGRLPFLLSIALLISLANGSFPAPYPAIHNNPELVDPTIEEYYRVVDNLYEALAKLNIHNDGQLQVDTSSIMRSLRLHKSESIRLAKLVEKEFLESKSLRVIDILDIQRTNIEGEILDKITLQIMVKDTRSSISNGFRIKPLEIQLFAAKDLTETKVIDMKEITINKKKKQRQNANLYDPTLNTISHNLDIDTKEPRLPKNETGAGQINQLLAFFKGVNCTRNPNFYDVCERGTVQVDPWLLNALQFQRTLAANTPVNFVQFLGTHNSFNDRSDGYGEYDEDLLVNWFLERIFPGQAFVYAQQEYTMTDQLNMGNRALHLDPHWFFGDVRLCHSGVEIWIVDKIVQLIRDIFHIEIDFDSQNLFCSPFDTPWREGLQEVRDWMDKNPQELIFVHHDDQAHWTWNHQKEVVEPLRNIMGENLFTPLDKKKWFPHRWPTSNELLKLNKTIFFQSETRYGSYDNTTIFPTFIVPNWDFDCMNHYSRYPYCGRYQPGDWFTFQGESQILGPLYDGSTACGLVIPLNFPYLTECDVNLVELDQVTPQLMTYGVWTWAAGQPVKGSVCSTLHMNDRRWYSEMSSQDCPSTNNSTNNNSSLYFACQSDSDPYTWTVGKSVDNSNSSNYCPSGFHWEVPRDGFMNQRLIEAATGIANVKKVLLNIENPSPFVHHKYYRIVSNLI